MNANWKARWGAVLLAFATIATVAATASPAAAEDYLRVKGLEVLPQSLNPAGAVFVYDLFNQRNRWKGFGFVEVDHGNQLPYGEYCCVPVRGGKFHFLNGWRFVSGLVWGGEVCTTYDPDVYDVYLYMVTHHGEYLCFYGQLDHRPLYRIPPSVPTVNGYLGDCFAPASPE